MFPNIAALWVETWRSCVHQGHLIEAPWNLKVLIEVRNNSNFICVKIPPLRLEENDQPCALLERNFGLQLIELRNDLVRYDDKWPCLRIPVPVPSVSKNRSGSRQSERPISAGLRSG